MFKRRYHMVFHIGKCFFPEAGDLRKRDNDGIHQPYRKITLREIKHLMFNIVPVIRLEWQPHAPIDVIPEYLVATDCVECVRGDVAGFCTVHETFYQCIK